MDGLNPFLRMISLGNASPSLQDVFMRPDLFWMATISFFGGIFYVVAFTPTSLSYPWSIFETINLTVFRTQYISQLVFYLAVAIHVGETLYALTLTQKMGMGPKNTLAWGVSTLLFGCTDSSLLFRLQSPPVARFLTSF